MRSMSMQEKLVKSVQKMYHIVRGNLEGLKDVRMKKAFVLGGLSFILVALLGLAGLFFVQSKFDAKYGFDGESYTLCKGEVSETHIGGGDLSRVTVTSDNETVASLNGDGNIEALTPGETVITVDTGVFIYRAKVTVNDHKGKIVNCEEPFECEACKNMILIEGGHKLSELTCTEDSVCEVCGYVDKVATGHSFSRATCLKDSVCRKCGEVGQKALGHDFNPATCLRPEVCRRCFLSQGEPVDHVFKDATCTEDSECKWCGEPGEEKATGHEFIDATCTTPVICTKCGERKGEPLGHKPGKQVCGKPSVCTRCNETLSEALPHDWREATCAAPKTCARCKATEGKALDHTVVEATCTMYSYCAVCGKVFAPALGHDYVTTETSDSVQYTCSVCGYSYKIDKVNIDSYAYEVLAIVNREREANGLSALSMDSSLKGVAQTRATEIVSSFSHTRPNGTSCFTAYNEAGYSYGYAGENIAYGQSSPSAVMTAWMNSSGHRANILSENFSRIGVGVYQPTPGGRIYWVQNFSD